MGLGHTRREARNDDPNRQGGKAGWSANERPGGREWKHDRDLVSTGQQWPLRVAVAIARAKIAPDAKPSCVWPTKRPATRSRREGRPIPSFPKGPGEAERDGLRLGIFRVQKDRKSKLELAKRPQKKEKDAWNTAASATAFRHPCPVGSCKRPRNETQSACETTLLAELQGLHNNGLLMMTETATKSHGGGH